MDRDDHARQGTCRLVELLDRAIAGDTEAYGDFVDQTSSTAWPVMRPTGREDDAEAQLIHCYIEAWQDLDEFYTSGMCPLTWLLCRLPRAFVSVKARPAQSRHEPVSLRRRTLHVPSTGRAMCGGQL